MPIRIVFSAKVKPKPPGRTIFRQTGNPKVKDRKWLQLDYMNLEPRFQTALGNGVNWANFPVFHRQSS